MTTNMCCGAAANKRVNLAVDTVASLARNASAAPGRPAGYARRWAGLVPRRAKLEAPAPRDPGPLPSVRPVCAATRGLTRRRFQRFLCSSRGSAATQGKGEKRPKERQVT